MKLNLKHKNVTSTHELDTWVEEQITSLQPGLKIDAANVSLVREAEGSPPYQVKAHLVTPGPDVLAEGRDHTLRAAFHKLMQSLRSKIGSRATRKQKRQRNAPQIVRAN